MIRAPFSGNLDPEPTPEFNLYCLDTVTRWEAGALPVQEALADLNTALQEATTAGHLANQARAHHLLGYVHHYRGNLNTSIKHYEQARMLYKQINNLNRVATMDLNLGENYRFKGDFTLALRLYKVAFEAAKQFNNITLQTLSIMSEGLTLLQLEHYTPARKAFQEALHLTTLWQDDPDKRAEILCQIHHGMAVIYLHEANLMAAWDEAVQALEIAHENSYPLHLGVANRTMGEVMSRFKTSPDAAYSSDPASYFKAALAAFQEINAEAEIARTMYAQAMSQAQHGRRTTAGRLLQQAMIIFTRLEMVDDVARVARAQLAVL